jgi:hypothetical protein
LAARSRSTGSRVDDVMRTAQSKNRSRSATGSPSAAAMVWIGTAEPISR